MDHAGHAHTIISMDRETILLRCRIPEGGTLSKYRCKAVVQHWKKGGKRAPYTQCRTWTTSDLYPQDLPWCERHQPVDDPS